MIKKKALVLFSGGLDSRVTAKFIEELGFEVHLCFVKLPFGSSCGSSVGIKEFSEKNNFNLHVIDATKGNLLKEYIEIVKNPKYGRGTAINPCKDCKIFIFIQGKKLAEKIGADVILTGEVLGQRPMSQMKKALMFDEKKAGLVGKLLRPLSAKLLPETVYEKEGIVDRKKLLDIHGRRREKQMKLAEKYKIDYPTPGGGCLLCENLYARKLEVLLDYIKQPSISEINLLKNGRMFKNKGLIFVGKNERENEELEKIAKKLGWNIFKKEGIPGPSIVYDKSEDEELVKKLWKVYSEKDLNERKKFEKFKI
jgi:tRNA U34 2-thiouridine synthase MnmA/TrmU